MHLKLNNSNNIQQEKKKSTPVYACGPSRKLNHYNKHMVQHKRANSSRQDSGVYLHLKDKGQSFKDNKPTYFTQGENNSSTEEELHSTTYPPPAMLCLASGVSNTQPGALTTQAASMTSIKTPQRFNMWNSPPGSQN